MFWADKVAADIIASGKHKPYWVDDMKTPSGFSHVGSLMGPVIHSMIFRALKDAGREATYTFVINDFDTMDELSPELDECFRQYMGMSLKHVPSPVAEYKNLADYFADDFINSIKSLGVEAEILSSWELYHQGKFDSEIKDALDNAERIQDLYQEISGSQKKASGWLPFQVFCEQCGKLGTTKVFAWDGKEVSYRCEPNLVKWAAGCGHEGKISPFGGNGKFPWKVDWPAHWKVIGITVEGAGKDHASKGGSYDIAMALCEEVFNYEKPFRLPYEFLLIGGKKMSSSKGVGLKAHDLVKILPPQVGRFLFARSGIKSQSNFDPIETDAIPVLFDDYQKAADAFFSRSASGGNKGDGDLARAFELSQIARLDSPSSARRGEIQKPPTIRFSVLAQWVQMPNMEEEIKKEGLEEWAEYARVWVEKFAPEKDKFTIQKTVPASVQNLSNEQKEFLKKVAKELDKQWNGEELQTRIYDIGKEMGLSGKEAFAAIYISLIGKDHGPKAAWLILSLDKEFVKKRFNEASK
jgi:lysyl-tRNA synthetase, class I